MSTPQISLADCLAEVNNALNYWYPLPVRDSKLDEELGSDRPYGASREECDARHVRLFQFRDRLQQQLRAAGKFAAFDLAMAMAELANVAAERDKLKSELAELRRDLLDANQERYKAITERDELKEERDKFKAERHDLAMLIAQYIAERDTARQSLRASEQDVAEIDTLCNDFRRANARLVAERDAMQTDNGILRDVNLRLTADLRAAMQRADTAESILRAKA
jgi:uncharacterized coiled-coil DUF342 family protein